MIRCGCFLSSLLANGQSSELILTHPCSSSLILAHSWQTTARESTTSCNARLHAMRRRLRSCAQNRKSLRRKCVVIAIPSPHPRARTHTHTHTSWFVRLTSEFVVFLFCFVFLFFFFFFVLKLQERKLRDGAEPRIGRPKALRPLTPHNSLSYVCVQGLDRACGCGVRMWCWRVRVCARAV